MYIQIKVSRFLIFEWCTKSTLTEKDYIISPWEAIDEIPNNYICTCDDI